MKKEVLTLKSSLNNQQIIFLFKKYINRAAIPLDRNDKVNSKKRFRISANNAKKQSTLKTAYCLNASPISLSSSLTPLSSETSELSVSDVSGLSESISSSVSA